MNKKSMIGDWLYWIFYIPLTVFIIILLVGIPNAAIKKNLDTHNLEYTILNYRIIKSLSYINPDTNRIEIGVIDLEKVRDENLKENFAQKGIGAKVSLKGIENDDINKEIFYDKEFYDSYIFLPGITKKIYVLVKDNNEIKKAVLEIDIVFAKKRELNE